MALEDEEGLSVPQLPPDCEIANDICSLSVRWRCSDTKSLDYCDDSRRGLRVQNRDVAFLVGHGNGYGGLLPSLGILNETRKLPGSVANGHQQEPDDHLTASGGVHVKGQNGTLHNDVASQSPCRNGSGLSLRSRNISNIRNGFVNGSNRDDNCIPGSSFHRGSEDSSPPDAVGSSERQSEGGGGGRDRQRESSPWSMDRKSSSRLFPRPDMILSPQK